MNFLELAGIDDYVIKVLAVNCAITIILMAFIPFIYGLMYGVNAKEELLNRDNPAFGISVAGLLFGLAITMTGVTSGRVSDNLLDETIIVACNGFLGIALMSVSRIIFDKLLMPNIHIQKEIENKNIAVGIVDFGNVISTALIVRASMIWVDSISIDGTKMVIIAYLISQVLLSAATLYRIQLYSFTNKNKTLNQAFENGNIPRAISFCGYKIGAALAVTGATALVPYDITEMQEMVKNWSLLALALTVIITVLSMVVRKVILLNIDITDEIDNQNNLAVALLESVIHISIGLLIAHLIW